MRNMSFAALFVVPFLAYVEAKPIGFVTVRKEPKR